MTETQMHERQTLLRFRADDGFLISAWLVTPTYKKKEDILGIPVLIQIHGLLGHFLARGTPRLLPHALLDHGFHSMSINTRLAFAGQMTSRGILDNTTKDIDAAVEFLAREGSRNIFILGYSLGATMLVHWAAHREHPYVRGLVLEGGHYSIPDSLRKRSAKWRSMPTYDEVYAKAQTVLGDDPYNSTNDETFVVYRASGPSREPIHSEIFTYKTWWFMAGPEAHTAMAYKHIGKINLPILMIRGENDELVEGWEPEALAQIAQEACNTHVRVRQIPSARHDCMENPDEMLKEIVNLMSTYSK
jgi:alpha-beta hydrolase superfamily lysophospholipase